MRIISGSVRGKILAGFPGRSVRPTADRVREALFSILHSRLGGFAGLRVLDLFAGTGALALEALSRGAERAVLVEAAEESLRIIRRNISACRFDRQAAPVRGEVPAILTRLAGDAPFDLVFLDPPYGQGRALATLEALAASALLAPAALVAVETGRDEALPATCGPLTQLLHRQYGSSAIHLFQLNVKDAMS